MCIAVPGQIMDISNNLATVNIMDVVTVVNVQLIAEPQIGDYVLVHAGCAIEKLNPAYFNDLLELFKSMIDEDEG